MPKPEQSKKCESSKCDKECKGCNKCDHDFNRTVTSRIKLENYEKNILILYYI